MHMHNVPTAQYLMTFSYRNQLKKQPEGPTSCILSLSFQDILTVPELGGNGLLAQQMAPSVQLRLRQATFASSTPNRSSQTLPHTPLCMTCSLPMYGLSSDRSLIGSVEGGTAERERESGRETSVIGELSEPTQLVVQLHYFSNWRAKRAYIVV